MNEDLHDCLFVQPKSSKKFPPPNKATRQLAQEMVEMTGGDREQMEGILKQLFFENPDRSIEWYFEQAVYRLQRVKNL